MGQLNSPNKSPVFVLRCPHCKNTMKYQPLRPNLTNKRKTCVYCGKSFAVKDKNIRDS